MARSIHHNPNRPNFDPKMELVTRTEFVAAGRPFGRGQVFNWKSLDIEVHRVRRLYEAGHVVHPELEADRVPEPTDGSGQLPKEGEASADTSSEAAADTPTDVDNTTETTGEADAEVANADAPGATNEADDGLDGLKVTELQELVKAEGVKPDGYKKDQLIAAIRAKRQEG